MVFIILLTSSCEVFQPICYVTMTRICVSADMLCDSMDNLDLVRDATHRHEKLHFIESNYQRLENQFFRFYKLLLICHYLMLHGLVHIEANCRLILGSYVL